jgi:hypothetical protein
MVIKITNSFKWDEYNILENEPLSVLNSGLMNLKLDSQDTMNNVNVSSTSSPVEANNECRCGEFISPQRLKAGYFVCLTCGEERAEKEKQRKARSIVPAYNKGGYTYITNKEDLKNLDPKHRS